MRKRLLLLTGSPGVGKTTVLLKIVEALGAKGYKVAGILSREVRSSGIRVGFELLDLATSDRGWLAWVDQKSGPQVGKYRVVLEDLDRVGAQAIARAVESAGVIVIDEIGPMELFSDKFKDAVRKALQSQKLVIGVVHWKSRDRLIDEAKAREDSQVWVVTQENRGSLAETVVQKALEFLENR